MTAEVSAEHDADQCGICLDQRARALQKRGVTGRLVELLRTSLDARTIAILETATPEQIFVLNRAVDDRRP